MADIKAMWDQDINDRPCLVLTREGDRITLSEAQGFLKSAGNGSYNGTYVMAIDPMEQDTGSDDCDQWVLYPVRERESCPICGGRV